MIVDDGMLLFIDGIRIECKENPLSALARILHEQQLVLLDWQMLTCNSMLSASEALLYIKETGLEVADGKGNLYRYQDGVIFKGKDIAGKIPEGEYLPESALLLFSSLDTQPVLPDGELGLAVRQTKGALPG